MRPGAAAGSKNTRRGGGFPRSYGYLHLARQAVGDPVPACAQGPDRGGLRAQTLFPRLLCCTPRGRTSICAAVRW